MKGAHTIYFWNKNQVTAIDLAHPNWNIEGERFRNLLCVDGRAATDDPRMRYGMFTKIGWRPVALENFPKEFRVHLLLLGEV